VRQRRGGTSSSSPLAVLTLCRAPAAASDPRDATHAFNLAHHLDELGEYDEAAMWYKKAIKIDVEHGPALSNYAALLWKHFQDKENAAKFHQRAVRASPNDADVYYNYALFLEEVAQKFDWAKDMYDKAVSKKSRDPNIYLAAAQFYLRRRRDFAKCMELHKLALRCDSDHIPSLLSYARFLEFDRKDYKNAATFYQRACEVKGASAEDEAEALGEAARFSADRTGNLELAEEAFKRAMARSSGLSQGEAQAAGVKKVDADGNEEWPEGNVGASPATLRLYSTFLLEKKNDPTGADKIWTDVIGHDADGEDEGAGEASSKLADRKPQEQHDMLLEYARYLSEDREEHGRASDRCREAIKAYPKDPASISLYAHLLWKHHADLALADKYYRQAIKLNPNYVPALLEYARFQLDKGEVQMADYYFKHTLKKDPSNAEAMLAYAQFMREHRHDNKAALDLYRQVFPAFYSRFLLYCGNRLLCLQR
jgi:Tfp pilus assembly protein PilF